MADKLTDVLFAATSDRKAKGAKLVEALGILSDLQAGRVANKSALQLRELRISQRRQGGHSDWSDRAISLAVTRCPMRCW